MPDPTYKFHPVYDDKGKRIKVDPPADLPETSGKKLRLGYPFHILKKPGDSFIIKNKELASSLRSQASKQNAKLLHWRIQVTSCDLGLLVQMIG